MGIRNLALILTVVGGGLVVIGLLSRTTVREAIADFWTRLADVKWGQLVARDAERFLSVILNFFKRPWSLRYFIRVTAVSTFLNALLLFAYMFITYKGPLQVGTSQLVTLARSGIIFPGMIIDFISLTITIYLMVFVAYAAKSDWTDVLLYAAVVLLDVFLVTSFVAIGLATFEGQRWHLYQFINGNIPTYDHFDFLENMVDALVRQVRHPLDFLLNHLREHARILHKYGIGWLPILLCLLTTALPTLLHLLIMLLSTIGKLFQTGLKPVTLLLADGLYRFGTTWLGKHTTAIGGWLLVIGSVMAAAQELLQP